MKKLNVLIVLLTLVFAVSCGGDKKKKGDSVGFYDLTQNPYQAVSSSVVNGLFNPQSGVLEVGGQSYQPNQIYGIQQTGQVVTGQQQMPMQYQAQPSLQLGQQYLISAYQQIQQNPYAFRPAYQENGIVKFNVRVTYYTARYPGMPAIIPVLTAPVVAF